MTHILLTLLRCVLLWRVATIETWLIYYGDVTHILWRHGAYIIETWLMYNFSQASPTWTLSHDRWCLSTSSNICICICICICIHIELYKGLSHFWMGIAITQLFVALLRSNRLYCGISVLFSCCADDNIFSCCVVIVEQFIFRRSFKNGTPSWTV